MIKRIFGIVLLIFVSFIAKSTHQVAGYITFKWISGTTYEVTIYDYTNTYMTSADRDTMRLWYGDGTNPALNSDLLPRLYGPIDQYGYPNGVPLCNYSGDEPLFGARKINIYRGTHTYPGPGRYSAWFDDPDRMVNISNICNSVNVDFYIHNTLVIQPFTSLYDINTPIIVNPPVCLHGCTGQCYYYNPGAYSPDGDSLVYTLGKSLVLGGLVAPCYKDEGATVDHERGTLSWCSPDTPGIYNFVINVISLRRVYINGGTKVVLPIDTTEVELEVIIDPCNENVTVTAQDTCVEAGSTTTLHYKATATGAYLVNVSYSGEPFSDSPPATFTSNSPANPVNATFKWTTACPEIRANPYEVIVKGTIGVPDYSSLPPDTNFYTGIGTSEITVIGPPPPYVDATVDGTTVCLHWGPSPCTNAMGYNIYRHTGCYNFPRSACETGVPSSSGYVLIGTTTSLYDTTLCDSNGGAGLDPGVYYSYVVDATYPDSAAAVSIASPDTCVEIKRSVPLITNVSVTQTDISNGVMFVRWTKPELGVNGLDTNQYHGPYQYVLSRADGLTGSNYTVVTTINPPYFRYAALDTTFSNFGLNTQQQPYNYKVDFYFTDSISGALKLVGSASKASSIFTTLRRSSRTIYLNWSYAVPWNDSSFSIYRKDPTATTFNFIGTSTGTQYTDTAGLLNGQNYCYYVESRGGYADTTVLHPLFDSSQIICGIPEDTLPPCTPVLTVSPKCNLYEDSLVWTNPDNTCPKRNKVVYYEVFYTPTQGGDMSIIATITDPNDTLFVNTNLTSIAGCYAVVAVDSFGHVTPIVSVCVDNCPQYVLPNVFTPNGDGNNDLFTPILPYRYVKDIDINIYNRWGTILFHTNNPMINWDGTDEHSHQPCPDGVYYYICTVNEIRVDGIKPIVLHGYVQIIR